MRKTFVVIIRSVAHFLCLIKMVIMSVITVGWPLQFLQIYADKVEGTDVLEIGKSFAINSCLMSQAT